MASRDDDLTAVDRTLEWYPVPLFLDVELEQPEGLGLAAQPEPRNPTLPPEADEDELDDERPLPRDNYSRPPAPHLDFDAGAALPELAASASAAVDRLQEEREQEQREWEEHGPRTVRTPRWLGDRWGDASAQRQDDEPPRFDIALAEAADDTFDDDRDDVPDAAGLRNESFPPVVEELDGDEPSDIEPWVAQRQAQMRRVVGVGIGACGLLLVAAVAGASLRLDVDMLQAEMGSAARHSIPSLAHATVLPHPTAEQPAAPEPSAAMSDADYDALAERTVDLLQKRQLGLAEASARKLVQGRPDHAFGYRCLGGALQDQGKMRAAQDAYSDCVRHATTGDVFECGALGGRPDPR
jgi:hypothetical protein